MNNDKTYQLLLSKMQEVAAIPTQSVGPFTGIYKRLTPFFKFYPWKSAALISFFATVFLYLLFGATLIKLASVLQFGF